MSNVKVCLEVIEKSDSELLPQIFHGGFEGIKENCSVTLFGIFHPFE
jgi:hypothetical protein